MGSFILGVISIWMGVVCPSLQKKIFINLPRTYEKLHCKGESCRFSEYRDPMVHKDIQADTDPVTFIGGYLCEVTFKLTLMTT